MPRTVEDDDVVGVIGEGRAVEVASSKPLPPTLDERPEL
jgi:hypothetical protein